MNVLDDTFVFQHGAGINVTDADGWSPLSILNTDRETFKHSLSKCCLHNH